MNGIGVDIRRQSRKAFAAIAVATVLAPSVVSAVDHPHRLSLPVLAASVPASAGATAAPNAAPGIGAALDDWLVRFDVSDAQRFGVQALDNLEALLAAAGMPANVEALALPASVRVRLPTPQTASVLQALLEAYAPVLRIAPNHRWAPAATPDDPSFESQWGVKNLGQVINATPDQGADGYRASCDSDPDDGLDLCDRDPGVSGFGIDAPTAWDRRTDADGVLVAVIDSGIDPHHPDLAGRVWTNPNELENGIDDDLNGFVDDLGGWDACDDDGDPDDLIGHGTEVAGIIGAAGNDGFGIAGVGWNTQIVGIKFIGPTPIPQGEDCNLTSAAIDALEFARVVGADVVNMSWGGGSDDEFLLDKLKQLIDDGIVLVAATGNSGVDLEIAPFYPAAYELDGMLSVAAHTNDGNVSTFSNVGGSTDLAAPGVALYTIEQAYEDIWDFANFDGYSGAGGTLAQGVVDGTNFEVVESGAAWGMAELTNGQTALIGDYAAAADGRGYSAGLDQTLEAEPIDAAAWGAAVLRFGATFQLEDGAQLAVEYSSDGGSTWTAVPGAVLEGANSTEFVLDLEPVIGSLPDDLRARFRLTTQTALDDGNVPGGVYLYSVLWVKTGDAGFDYDANADRVYRFVQGTSFAAPFAAGAAALVRAEAPGLDSADVVQQLVVKAKTLAQESPGIPFNRRLHIASVFEFEPTLVWTGAEGFVHDGVEPDPVDAGAPVTFAVDLFDPEGEAGTGIVAGVVINDPDGGSNYLPLTDDGAGGWLVTTSLAEPGDYGYRFVVTAATGDLGGEPASSQALTVAGDGGSSPGGAGGGNGEVPETSSGCACHVGGGPQWPTLPAWLLLIAAVGWSVRRLRSGTAS